MTSKGFSFIEVMTAMVVLSIALVILLDSQGSSMDLVSRARSLDYATTLASAKMTELTQEAISKGIHTLRNEEAGEFDQEKHPGYRWRYQTLKVPTPDFAKLMTGFSGGEGDTEAEASNAELFAGPLQMIQEAWGEALRELHVEVYWLDGNREKSLELVTHLIAPDAVTKIQSLTGGLKSAGQTGGS